MLNDSQVAQYLRAKAKRYLDMAIELESSSGSISALIEPSLIKSSEGVLPTLSPITFESLMAELDKKAGRVKHVAKRLNTSEQMVRDLINSPNSRYYVAAKGWIKSKISV